MRRAISVSIRPERRCSSARIDANSGALHPRQHARQRQFDLVVQLAQAARSMPGASASQISSVISACCSGAAAQLEIEPAPRLLLQRTAGRVGIQQKRIEHHVVLEAARLDPELRSVSIADFTSQAIFFALSSSSQGFNVRQSIRRTARASPCCHASRRSVSERELAFGRISKSPPPPARRPAASSHACSSVRRPQSRGSRARAYLRSAPVP